MSVKLILYSHSHDVALAWFNNIPSPDALLLIPFAEFGEWSEGRGTTEREDRFYWQVVIYREENRYVLHRRKKEERIDLSRYLLAGRQEAATM